MSTALPSEDEVRTLVAAVLAGMTRPRPRRRRSLRAAAGALRRPASTPPENRAEIAVGADHGGYALKEKHRRRAPRAGARRSRLRHERHRGGRLPRLRPRGGPSSPTASARYGIVVDGAGIGSCIAANKVPGVRAATCWDVTSARNSREHNHANVLVLGAGLLGERLALEIVDAWLATPWGGDRHARRVEKITEIERRYLAAREGVAA